LSFSAIPQEKQLECALVWTNEDGWVLERIDNLFMWHHNRTKPASATKPLVSQPKPDTEQTDNFDNEIDNAFDDV
jgi:hypothetical protein